MLGKIDSVYAVSSRTRLIYSGIKKTQPMLRRMLTTRLRFFDQRNRACRQHVTQVG